MNLDVILASTVMATVVSGVFAYFRNKKENNLQYITTERKQWREEIRKIAEEFYTKPGEMGNKNDFEQMCDELTKNRKEASILL